MPWHTSYQKSKQGQQARDQDSDPRVWSQTGYLKLNPWILFTSFYNTKKTNLQRCNELSVIVHIILIEYMQCFFVSVSAVYVHV